MSVRFSFDATSRLAPQLLRGAPADVFISADREWMLWLEERDGIEAGSVRSVAQNQLVYAVPFDAAFAPTAPEGLADPDVRRIALAGEDVPAGRYAPGAAAYEEPSSGWRGLRSMAGSSTAATRWQTEMCASRLSSRMRTIRP